MLKNPLVAYGTNVNEIQPGDTLAGIPGQLLSFAGSDIPDGYIACEGQLLAVTDYPELFAAIGNAYGGDGVATFALPNMRGGRTKKIIFTDKHPQIVQSVSVPGTIHGPLSGYYNAGDTLSFSVQLLEGIAVSGGPVELSVDIGGTVHTLAFTDGTATEWIFAGYVVQPGDGDAVTAALDLNGAALITVAEGHAATLSIGSYSGAIVDTTAPVVPTVNTLTTASHTPTITGTATVGSGEELTVIVNGIMYQVDDGNLTLSGTAWALVIPAANQLNVGTYNVTATVTDLAGNASNDSTTAELIITA